tara:strand:+ start:1469 stop:1813 length:345 start_codon:yes stop_codon:yes gene_type:complete
VNYNSDFRHDLEVGQVAERELGEIFEGKKVEVKNDLRALDTGNVYVEYESRGKASGIATSEAEWYAFKLSDTQIRLIKTKHLKELCRGYVNTERDKKGGDSNTSKGILLPLTKL